MKIRFVNKIYCKKELIEELLFTYKPDKIEWDSDWSLEITNCLMLPFDTFEKCYTRAFDRAYGKETAYSHASKSDFEITSVTVSPNEKRNLAKLKLATKIENP